MFAITCNTLFFRDVCRWEVERGKRKEYGQQQKYAVKEIFFVFVLNVPVNIHINSQGEFDLTNN